MQVGNQDYYARRVREELAKAQSASSLEVKHVHETMARLYRIRLAKLEKERIAA